MKLSSLQKGLVLHAPLSEERYNPATKRVDDLTPYENHGTADAANLGVFVADRMGQLGRAMQFNGSTDKVTIPTLSMNDTQNTFSFWVNFNSSQGSIGNNDIILGSKYYTNNDFAITQDNVSNRIRLTVGFGDFAYILIPIVVGEWMHIVYVYDSDEASWDNAFKAYCNNELLSFDSSGTTELLRNARNIVIGGGSFFEGSLADIRIYNRVISQEEITTLYEQYNSKVIL